MLGASTPSLFSATPPPSGSSMRQSSTKCAFHEINSSQDLRAFVRDKRETLASRIVTYLRRKYPNGMAECVSRDTGINIYAIRKLEYRLSAPSLAAFYAMADAYGIEFLAFVFQYEWLDQVKRDTQESAVKARVSALKARLKKS